MEAILLLGTILLPQSPARCHAPGVATVSDAMPLKMSCAGGVFVNRSLEQLTLEYGTFVSLPEFMDFSHFLGLNHFSGR